MLRALVTVSSVWTSKTTLGILPRVLLSGSQRKLLTLSSNWECSFCGKQCLNREIGDGWFGRSSQSQLEFPVSYSL